MIQDGANLDQKSSCLRESQHPGHPDDLEPHTDRQLTGVAFVQQEQVGADIRGECDRLRLSPVELGSKGQQV